MKAGNTMAADALEKSVLESKDKDQLVQIAQALGVSASGRASKSTLIDLILEQTGGSAAPAAEEKASGNDGDGRRSSRRASSQRASDEDDDHDNDHDNDQCHGYDHAVLAVGWLRLTDAVAADVTIPRAAARAAAEAAAAIRALQRAFSASSSNSACCGTEGGAAPAGRARWPWRREPGQG